MSHARRVEIAVLGGDPGWDGGLCPRDPEHFGIRVQAFIGSRGSDAADSFDVIVCTPSWLAEHFDDEHVGAWNWEQAGVRFGNRFLFMKRCDYVTLSTAVTEPCATHQADDWGALPNRIGRHIPWEFDYRYDNFVDQTAGHRPRFPPDG